ncbi:MAG: histidine--tRNA ligase [Patescibacteria group bacterium]
MSKNKDEKLSTEPYKGVRDFYPAESAQLRYILNVWRTVAERWGYAEYKASILEPSDLYKAKGADNEELVKEQTYTFTDRGGREVTLRPEMTPTVARMVAGRRRELGYPLRWYSIPNCFRYERPQRGRGREFWQLNVDIFGSTSLAADAEIIQIAYDVMKAFGATDGDFVIKIGSRKEINRVAAEMGLDEARTKQFMALLDRKAKMDPEEFAQQFAAFGANESVLYSAAPQEVQALLEQLRAMGVANAEYDPSVVRGFAYYTDIMFEVFDTAPENNRAMFGGGRYDNLTELFDDEPLPGVGFGMGDMTIADFLEVRGLLPAYMPPTVAYIAVAGAELGPEAQQLAQELRAAGVNVAVDFGEKKLGDQIKAASKGGVPWLIVVGQDELASGTFNIKNLNTGAEEKMARSQLAQFFLNL